MSDGGGANILGNDQGVNLVVASVTGTNSCNSFPCTIATAHGSVTVNADGTFTYVSEFGYVGPDSFTYVAKDSANQTTNTATVNFNVEANNPNLFDPPSGRKVITRENLPFIEWQMVWINNGNAVAVDVEITDSIPAGSFYRDGSLSCAPRGTSTVTYCTYEAGANRVVYRGSIAPDPGATTEQQAQNEVVITYQTSVLPTTLGVSNQGCARVVGATREGCSDDPGTSTPGDPTVWHRPTIPGTPPVINPIPTLSPPMTAILLLMVGLLGAVARRGWGNGTRNE